MPSFPPPPYRSTIFDRVSGLVDFAWLKWFQDFFNIITGTVDNGTLESFDWQNTRDYAGEIQQAALLEYDPPQNYRAPIADLERLQAFGSGYAGELRDRIEALEQLVALSDAPAPPTVFVIRDLFANQVNYNAQTNDGVFFYATDTVALYISDAGAWQGPI